MEHLIVRLFGQLSIRFQDRALTDLEGARVRELFCFLVTHRNTVFLRERLADQFWGGTTTKQSRKNLRHTLWKLQSTLRSISGAGNIGLVISNADTIRLNPDIYLWVDVAEFEQAFACIRGQCEPDAQKAEKLKSAVELYRGDFLEGWYRDWCLCERERLQNMYLEMLDWLVCFCDSSCDYHAGLAYGERIIQLDSIRERTHQQLMRMYYLAGDRTAALHQYERCVKALQIELGISPSAQTVLLFEQIRAERPMAGRGTVLQRHQPPPPPSSLPEILNHLHYLQNALVNLQHQVCQDIDVVEKILSSQMDTT